MQTYTKTERDSLKKYLGELLAPLTDHYTLSTRDLELWVDTTAESMMQDGVRARLRTCRGCDEKMEGLDDDLMCDNCQEALEADGLEAAREDR